MWFQRTNFWLGISCVFFTTSLLSFCVGGVVVVVVIIVVYFHLLSSLAMSMLLLPSAVSTILKLLYSRARTPSTSTCCTKSWDRIIALPEKPISRNTVLLPLKLIILFDFPRNWWWAQTPSYFVTFAAANTTSTTTFIIFSPWFTLVRRLKVKRKMHKN